MIWWLFQVFRIHFHDIWSILSRHEEFVMEWLPDHGSRAHKPQRVGVQLFWSFLCSTSVHERICWCLGLGNGSHMQGTPKFGAQTLWDSVRSIRENYYMRGPSRIRANGILSMLKKIGAPGHTSEFVGFCWIPWYVALCIISSISAVYEAAILIRTPRHLPASCNMDACLVPNTICLCSSSICVRIHMTRFASCVYLRLCHAVSFFSGRFYEFVCHHGGHVDRTKACVQLNLM